MAADLADVQYALEEDEVIIHSKISLTIEKVSELPAAVEKLTKKREVDSDEMCGFISFDFPALMPSDEQIKAYGNAANLVCESYVLLLTATPQKLTVDIYNRAIDEPIIMGDMNEIVIVKKTMKRKKEYLCVN